ncbi:MAG: peptide deformylase [Rickettsiales bacterium]|jgi:peptide deformylase|nr:peptide deformylase [Rickettsiales bacterium]
MKTDTGILQVGETLLREKSSAVEKVDSEVRAILDAMVAAMSASEGAGLAAPQVGVLKRMFIFRPTKDSAVVKMINPRLCEFSKNSVSLEEGCLSVLGPKGPVYAHVSRPEKVRVEWTDETGAPRSETFDGIPSRIIQHEFDHLEGVLFIDYVSSLKRAMIMQKVKKAQS